MCTSFAVGGADSQAEASTSRDLNPKGVESSHVETKSKVRLCASSPHRASSTHRAHHISTYLLHRLGRLYSFKSICIISLYMSLLSERCGPTLFPPPFRLRRSVRRPLDHPSAAPGAWHRESARTVEVHPGDATCEEAASS